MERVLARDHWWTTKLQNAIWLRIPEHPATCSDAFGHL